MPCYGPQFPHQENGRVQQWAQSGRPQPVPESFSLSPLTPSGVDAPSVPSPYLWPNPDPTGLWPALASLQPGGGFSRIRWGSDLSGSPTSFGVGQPCLPHNAQGLNRRVGAMFLGGGGLSAHPLKWGKDPFMDHAIIEHRLYARLGAGQRGTAVTATCPVPALQGNLGCQRPPFSPKGASFRPYVWPSGSHPRVIKPIVQTRKLKLREPLPAGQSTLRLTPARRPSRHPQATIVLPGEARHGAESPGGAARGGPELPPPLPSPAAWARPPGPWHRTGSQRLVPGAPRGQPTARPRPRPPDYGLCSLLGARRPASPPAPSSFPPSHTYCAPPRLGTPRGRRRPHCCLEKTNARGWFPWRGRGQSPELGAGGGSFQKTDMLGVQAPVVHRENVIGLRTSGTLSRPPFSFVSKVGPLSRGGTGRSPVSLLSPHPAPPC